MSIFTPILDALKASSTRSASSGIPDAAPILRHKLSPLSSMTLTVERRPDGLDVFRISAPKGDEFHQDVNAALRAFSYRAANPEAAHSGIPCILAAERISAPAEGLLELQEDLQREFPSFSALSTGINEQLAAWQTQFNTSRSLIRKFGLSDEGVEVRRDPLAGRRDLVMSIVPHIDEDLRDEGCALIRLTLEPDHGTPLNPVETEYFFDIALATRAFGERASRRDAAPSNYGMQAGTDYSDYEYRNAILSTHGVSMSRAEGDILLRTMMKTGLFEGEEGLYWLLEDALTATYSDAKAIWLGTAKATSDGTGLYAPGVKTALEFALKVIVRPETIERKADGSIEYAYCQFKAFYDQSAWNDAARGNASTPYTDKGVVDSINTFLSEKGLYGDVCWSEYGRQEPGVADFDMAYELIDQLWPELSRSLSSSPKPAHLLPKS